MKLRTTLTLLLLFTFVKSSLGQYSGKFKESSETFSDKYNDFIEPDEVKIRTWYHYVLTKDSKNYILRQFYPEKNRILSESRYINKDLSKKTGLNRVFENESFWEGEYKNNRKEGVWTTFSYKGDTLGVGVYKKGKMDGEFYERYISEGLLLKGFHKNGLKVGVWKVFFNDGTTKSSMQYENDKLEGAYMLYDTLGNLTEHYIYHLDKVEKIIVGEEKEELVPAMFRGCEHISELKERKDCAKRKMNAFISETIEYPEFALSLNIEGKTLFKFVVETDGSIGEIEVLEGLCQSFENESIRVIRSMPKWTPGEANGKVARVYFTIPFVYQLK